LIQSTEGSKPAVHRIWQNTAAYAEHGRDSNQLARLGCTTDWHWPTRCHWPRPGTRS